MSCARVAKPIKMPFEMLSVMGQRKHVLHGSPDRRSARAILRGKGAAHCKV